MNLIVTGRPGIGKTTVIEQVAAALGTRAGGFLTREVRRAQRRSGFLIESLDGQRRLLATRDRAGAPRVGPYRVIVSNLDAVGTHAVERALDMKEIVVVDEIGKMELISEAFRDIMLRALDSDKTVVATLGVSKDPFSEAVRCRPDISLLEVSRDNREVMASRIIRLIETEQ